MDTRSRRSTGRSARFGGDQLGTIAGPAVVEELIVPPFRGHDPSQGGNQACRICDTRERVDCCRWRRHPHDSVDARPHRHQADGAVPQHHRRGAAEGDDRRVGAPAPVEGGQSVASRGNLSVICQSRPKTRINSAKFHWSASPPIMGARFSLAATCRNVRTWRARQDSNLS
jgi:hypothetical protein